MRQYTALFAALLLTAACSSNDNEPGKRQKIATSSNVDETGAKEADANPGQKPVPSANKGKDGKPNPGKGDGGDGYDKGDGKGDDGKDGDLPPTDDGKGDDGGKDDKPSQTPDQKPGKPDQKPPMDEPDTVVDLPKGACQYLDPAKPEFTIAKNQFGPNLPPVAVPSRVIKGDLQADGETFIGAFTIYQIGLTEQFALEWDGLAGRIPHDYTLVVVGADDSKCTAYLKYVKQEPRTLNGCFDQNTRIRMASGKDLVIAAISEGDYVLNPVTKKGMRVAEVRKGEEKKPMYAIGFGGQEMVVTELHPVPVKGGLKQAKDVTTADYVYDEKGVIHRVTSARKMPVNGKQIVVNVRLEAPKDQTFEHMVLANGVVSGDLYLQRRLAGEATAAK